ncbi:MAG TPA: AmmeMemoRadiSam system radical SAM enzyme [bacterium]|nr:AmmeMemoRadiSam system radical SAM enzyme [bacterium]
MSRTANMIAIAIIVLMTPAFFYLAGRSPDEVSLLRKAEYAVQLPGNKVRCELCPHFCTLSDGQTGICKVRRNIKGKLYSLIYGQPVALNNDPVEKKPLFHFHPGTKTLSIATVGCNMNCNFCQNWEISQATPDSVTPYDMTPAQVVALAKKHGADSISFTYTEPAVFFEYMRDIAKLAHEKGLKTILVSCGYINEKPLLELSGYLDAANIDLKGFTEEFYRDYTNARLQPVLDTLRALKNTGVLVEVTNLIIPGANDKMDDIKKLARWIKENLGAHTPLHFSRFFPTYKLTARSSTPATTLAEARAVAQKEGLLFVYIGNIATDDGENTFCPKCKKRLIERNGFSVDENLLKNGKCPFCGEKIPGKW